MMGKDLVITEDVVTSGGAVINAVNDLRALGANICGYLSVVIISYKNTPLFYYEKKQGRIV